MVVPTTQEVTLERALGRVRDSFLVVERAGGYEVLEAEPGAVDPARLAAYLPACRLEYLGDPTFCADHGLRYPYYSGAMANGIGSVEIAEALGRAGMLGVFGAAGLALATVEAAVDRWPTST